MYFYLLTLKSNCEPCVMFCAVIFHLLSGVMHYSESRLNIVDFLLRFGFDFYAGIG